MNERPKITVPLPDGTTREIPLTDFTFNVQLLVVVDGRMMSAPEAVTYLHEQRQYWRERAERFEQQAADALARLQAST